ncbi:SUMF1/EgtB/PvdO family nonheme iron enzyme [Aerosakkonemataceae cyanobacterium BLCC-F154]|uniref:SUMF1/EgtB/PvdO family nonheme iron enzyme n=1 Tax=Floridaenema fluviatile BLCC-F154 TaxID=3153640 RepID=A0ABV4YGU7_9CYAN
MEICQNPNCSNPFNPDSNRFCSYCGKNNLGALFRNRFRVIRLIAEGGFGRTYQAEDIDRLNDPCVIKQFVPQVQGTAALNKAAELFKQEAKRLYELGEHPQIPRLISYFEQGKRLYLVEEFIQGKTLLEELQQSTFSEEQILQILTDLLPVLQFVHENKVIHRDIKPDNIIRRQTDGKLMLIDFGGAKQVTQTILAKPATGIYTLGYAAIEQMSGHPCYGSDLYSLGATCVRLLTGCLPVPDTFGDLNDPLYNSHEARWLWREYLQKKGVKVSNQLGEVLDKLLAHLPKDRYQSAAEVLQILNYPLSVNSAKPNSPQPQAKQRNNLQVFQFEVITVDAQGNKLKTERHQAEFFLEELGKSITLEMVFIPGGTFIMGSPKNQGYANEKPQHRVKIAPFFLGKYVVTQAQWEIIASLPKINLDLNPDPSYFKGANRPVEQVDWHEAQEFCERLSRKTGKNYRLPSEAEWEYACRAGTTTPFYCGDTITANLGNYHGNYTEEVGRFPPNAFGLYDMHGNVWEWCADPWHDSYDDAPYDGSVWEYGGDYNKRLLRGVLWNNYPWSCRSANRDWDESFSKFWLYSFRVAADSFAGTS